MLAHQTLQVTHSLDAIAFPLHVMNRRQNVRLRALPIHVAHILNVALLAIHMYVLAYPILLDHHLVVGLSVFLTLNAPVKKLALI